MFERKLDCRVYKALGVWNFQRMEQWAYDPRGYREYGTWEIVIWGNEDM